MRVIAVKQGYFGKLREPGEEFDVPDGAKASWFEALEQGVPGDAAPRSRKKANAPAEGST